VGRVKSFLTSKSRFFFSLLPPEVFAVVVAVVLDDEGEGFFLFLTLAFRLSRRKNIFF
jgi:hypothetical protein